MSRADESEETREPSEPNVIPFPKDDRWLICGCRKCEARREEVSRGA